MSSDPMSSLLQRPEWFEAFTKQELEGKWKPIPNFEWTIGFFVALTVVMLPLGGGVFYSATQNLNYSARYDNHEVAKKVDEIFMDSLFAGTQQFEITIEVREKMESPIDNPESRVYDTKRHKSVFITLILNWWSQLIRQDLPSVWDPRPSVFRSVLFFAILSFITVPLASTIIWQTHQNTEIILRYDSYIDSNKTLDNNIRKQQILNNSGSGILITNTLTIREDLESPVYVYYELKDFYQNHKRYVRSVEFEQIGKGNISASDLSVCKPYRLIPGNGNTDERVINPCGLLAHSYFNDTFKLQSSWTSDVADLGLKMKETGIATEWDRKYLYGDHEAKNFNEDVNTRGGGQIEGPLNEDEHFMVWMKVGSRPTVRKLYGIIESDIPKGAHLTFEIQNRYNTYDFSGEKRLILSTANWTGGRDIFTGILFFVIGGMSALACLVILFVDRRVNREAGDIRALSWERKKN